MKKILMLSVGRQTYLVDLFSKYFKVEIGDNSPLTLNLYKEMKSYLMPRYDSKDYAPFLKKIIIDDGIDFLLSLSDIEIALVTGLRPKLPANCELLMPNKEVSYQCLDKYAFSKLLYDNGIGCPKTYLTPKEVNLAINKGVLTYPIIGKSRWGMGSKGVTIIENERELDLYYHLYKNKFSAPVFLNCELERKDETLVLQEMINGEEFGLDIVNDLQGNWYTTAIKRKLMMRGGETDIAEVVSNNEIMKESHKIANVLRHKGNVDCDILIKDGVSYVIDINPRFGGGYIFSLFAGINVPYYIYCWSENIAISDKAKQIFANKTYRKITQLIEL